MSDALKMAFVGTGAVAQRGLIEQFTQPDIQDHVRLACLCDAAPGRAAAAARKFSVSGAYENYEQMLDTEKPDPVTLATPIGVHYEQGKMAIERGIHVHFNKTITVTVAEADELIAMAKVRDVKLVASPGQMINPANREVRRLLTTGALGQVTWAVEGAGGNVLEYHMNEPERQGNDPLSSVDPTWYLKKPAGGPLYDRVVYEMHTLTGILGPARRVTAMSGIRISRRQYRGQMIPMEMDDNTLMLLHFGESMFAFVYGAVGGGLPSAIFGTAGAIRRDNNGPTLNGKPIDYAGRAEGKTLRPHVSGAHETLGAPHIFEDVMQLVDWVREDKPSIVTAEHARHVIDIFESTYRSARSGGAQDLRTTFTPADLDMSAPQQ